VAGKLADAGLNLDAVYVVGVADDLIELAFAVDDVKKAKKCWSIGGGRSVSRSRVRRTDTRR